MLISSLIPLLGEVAAPFFSVMAEQLRRKDNPTVLQIATALLEPIMSSELGFEARKEAQKAIMPVAANIFAAVSFKDPS